MLREKLPSQLAFTLIELMVTTAISAILVSLAFAQFKEFVARGDAVKAITYAHQLYTAFTTLMQESEVSRKVNYGCMLLRSNDVSPTPQLYGLCAADQASQIQELVPHLFNSFDTEKDKNMEFIASYAISPDASNQGVQANVCSNIYQPKPRHAYEIIAGRLNNSTLYLEKGWRGSSTGGVSGIGFVLCRPSSSGDEGSDTGGGGDSGGDSGGGGYGSDTGYGSGGEGGYGSDTGYGSGGEGGYGSDTGYGSGGEGGYGSDTGYGGGGYDTGGGSGYGGY